MVLNQMTWLESQIHGAVWVGVSNKLDQSLLQCVADEFAKIGGSVVLIGPEENGMSPLQTTTQTYIVWGPSEVSKYLHICVILIWD